VHVVRVSVARLAAGGRCRFLTVRGRALPRTRCSRPFWLLARSRGQRWTLSVRGPLARGRYVARVRGTDVDGVTEAGRRRSATLRFRIGR
jgi:hypothetical protein